LIASVFPTKPGWAKADTEKDEASFWKKNHLFFPLKNNGYHPARRRLIGDNRKAIRPATGLGVSTKTGVLNSEER